LFFPISTCIQTVIFLKSNTRTRNIVNIAVQYQIKPKLKSSPFQVLEGKAQYIEMAGNLVPVTKSGDQPSLTFNAFHENRLALVVRMRDMTQSASARVAFMSESRVMRGDSPLAPTCTLNIALPDFAPGWGSKTDEDEESETHEQYQMSSKHRGEYPSRLPVTTKCDRRSAELIISKCRAECRFQGYRKIID